MELFDVQFTAKMGIPELFRYALKRRRAPLAGNCHKNPRRNLWSVARNHCYDMSENIMTFF